MLVKKGSKITVPPRPVWSFISTYLLKKISKKFCTAFFDVLLTVHLSIFILVINQLDAQHFCFTISLFYASTCFENMCSKHVEAWNKPIVKQKFCVTSWLITEINMYSMLKNKLKNWSLNQSEQIFTLRHKWNRSEYKYTLKVNKGSEKFSKNTTTFGKLIITHASVFTFIFPVHVIQVGWSIIPDFSTSLCNMYA